MLGVIKLHSSFPGNLFLITDCKLFQRHRHKNEGVFVFPCKQMYTQNQEYKHYSMTGQYDSISMIGQNFRDGRSRFSVWQYYIGLFSLWQRNQRCYWLCFWYKSTPYCSEFEFWFDLTGLFRHVPSFFFLLPEYGWVYGHISLLILRGKEGLIFTPCPKGTTKQTWLCRIDFSFVYAVYNLRCLYYFLVHIPTES